MGNGQIDLAKFPSPSSFEPYIFLSSEHEEENGLFITYSYVYDVYDGIESVFSLMFPRGKLTNLNNIYCLNGN